MASKPITTQNLANWKKTFYDEPKNCLAQNACSKSDPIELCVNRKTLERTQHVFNYRIESEGKPITNQKSSGRCWLFAALNCLRVPFAKACNIEEFEFSQAYLFYWDKIERCNYYLNTFVEVAKRGEQPDDRLMSFLLKCPIQDGGQWDMLLNLITKYGLMPKKCFPDTYSCEESGRVNRVLKSKLREYSKILLDLINSKGADKDIDDKITTQMGEIYNVVGICLGIPDELFTWEYYDKNKAYHSVGPITAVDFYEKHVKPLFNLDDKVCLVSDPRPSSSYNEMYTVDCLGNVIGGRPVLYNNQPIDVLISAVTNSIKRGDPVWFGCDFSRRIARKFSALDMNAHNFELFFGVNIEQPLNKSSRLLFGESLMTHAMIFTGVSCDNDGNALKFRVENSHGEIGEKGYMIMTIDWFKEYVFEVVVDKAIVSKDVLNVFNKTPLVLPAWDPMGALAE